MPGDADLTDAMPTHKQAPKGKSAKSSRERLSVRYEQIEPEAMARPLASLIRRNPVHCSPDTTVRSAVETMHRAGVGSLVVCDEQMVPIGIFTVQDVLARVTLRGIDLSLPVSQVMTGNLSALPARASAYDAALVMAGQGIHHVVIVEGGKFAGVVSERDLFMRPAGLVRRIGAELRRTQDRESLVRGSSAIPELTTTLFKQGLGSAQVTRLVSTLNDVLTEQAIRLEMRDAQVRDSRWCFIEMGSAGRFEQTLSTDQDNGIIFRHEPDEAPDAVRARLLPFAQRVNETLDACGIPLCRGGIMAGNPRCCLSVEEWRQRFADWIYQSDLEALLNATIFFDFRSQFGDAALAWELRRWLMQHAAGSRLFLAQMTQNALNNQPPLGVIRDFVPTGGKDHPNSIDLKVNAITPFVDAARILGLAAGVAETNTAQRLREAAQKLDLPAAEMAAWVDSFEFLQALRLKHQVALKTSGQALHNFLDLGSLNELERRILKESMRQASKLQSRLARLAGLMEHTR
jgi:CBS domain-containing protein